MMSLNDLISPQAVIPSMKANGKKQALIELADKAAEVSGIDSREILDALIQRERLGSTGIGGGIAIPHGKLARCQRIFGVFARLEKPMDFEALDDAPVDLIFLLIAPENAGADHLNALSRAARVLRDQSLVTTLRSTRDPSALYSILVRSPTPNAA